MRNEPFNVVAEEYNKHQSKEHFALKKKAARILESLGFTAMMEVKLPHLSSLVDIAGFKNGLKIAIECGNVAQSKIETLKTYYDIVVHIPYCWTPIFAISERKLANLIENELSAR